MWLMMSVSGCIAGRPEAFGFKHHWLLEQMFLLGMAYLGGRGTRLKVQRTDSRPVLTICP